VRVAARAADRATDLGLERERAVHLCCKRLALLAHARLQRRAGLLRRRAVLLCGGKAPCQLRSARLCRSEGLSEGCSSCFSLCSGRFRRCAACLRSSERLCKLRAASRRLGRGRLRRLTLGL
jgi:hypothetical protein